MPAYPLELLLLAITGNDGHSGKGLHRRDRQKVRPLGFHIGPRGIAIARRTAAQFLQSLIARIEVRRESAKIQVWPHGVPEAVDPDAEAMRTDQAAAGLEPTLDLVLPARLKRAGVNGGVKTGHVAVQNCTTLAR